jgi:hypothetical protein
MMVTNHDRGELEYMKYAVCVTAGKLLTDIQ